MYGSEDRVCKDQASSCLCSWCCTQRARKAWQRQGRQKHNKTRNRYSQPTLLRPAPLTDQTRPDRSCWSPLQVQTTIPTAKHPPAQEPCVQTPLRTPQTPLAAADEIRGTPLPGGPRHHGELGVGDGHTTRLPGVGGKWGGVGGVLERIGGRAREEGEGWWDRWEPEGALGRDERREGGRGGGGGGGSTVLQNKKQKSKSNVTPDPGGHQPQRPGAQGRTCSRQTLREHQTCTQHPHSGRTEACN